jgi:hypothetical protein
LFGQTNPTSFDQDRATHSITHAPQAMANSGAAVEAAVDPATELGRAFLRLANLPNYALDRVSRYEAALWRQVGQLLFVLDTLDRRNPLERRRRLPPSFGQNER